ncbi:uncharacterized protein LOC100374672, partial [Saccoglossus kowalevskii]|uniref:Uncharacterized protein LOC100374672 n=1 Tax=Saccoglossus kowalevskii TaxID=10224 RepID=A0ABM0GMF2_SACKO
MNTRHQRTRRPAIIKCPCVKCGQEVTARQQAMECDCGRWQHRKCATGITAAFYSEAMRQGTSFDWKCTPCMISEIPQPDNDERSMIASPTSNSGDDNEVMESTRLTNTSSPQHHEPMMVSIDADNYAVGNVEPVDELSTGDPPTESYRSDYADVPITYTNDNEVLESTRLTNVSSPQQHGPVNISLYANNYAIDNVERVEELSIGESPIESDISDCTDAPVTYAIVEGSTKRMKPKLIDSNGYTYTMKRKTNKGIMWTCPKRTKQMYCLASVVQRGGDFKRGAHDHLHPGLPGQATVAKVYSSIKSNASEKVFEPAGEIVEDAIREFVGEEPVPTLPSFDYLTRTTNRFRQKMRPDEPSHLMDFEINEDFLPPDFIHKDV